MRFPHRCLLLFLVWLGSLVASENLPAESRPWTRWWWMGSAVEEIELTRELEAFARAGFGGAEITPIYGVKGEESRFRSFLSPSYLAALRHVTGEAKRLGLQVEMATGTGWPFGGPHVSPADAETRWVYNPTEGQARVEPTAFRVKRAAPGGEGWVVDPFSVPALQRYLQPFTKALQEFPAGALHGQFHDSYEYSATWSTELPARFKAMHGYAISDAFEALAGKGDLEQRTRMKADYRAALESLHFEYIREWVVWVHQRGQQARHQAHGTPGNWLDFYAMADVPETELFGSTVFAIPGLRRPEREVGPDRPIALLHRFAASAAHLRGRPLVSAEAFTWLREHFHETPAVMKAEADRLFASGVNRLVYHGTAYSPQSAAWPGWLFYASSQINDRNPLWSFVPEMNRYFTRCQALLQSGSPDADVLVYWPFEDVRHQSEGLLQPLTVHKLGWLQGSPLEETTAGLEREGWAYDLVSDKLLLELKPENGRIAGPAGQYRAVVVPRTRLMPPETLAQLEQWSRAGVPVLFIAGLPEDVPGWGRLAERRTQFSRQIEALKAHAHFRSTGKPVEAEQRESGGIRGAQVVPSVDAGLTLLAQLGQSVGLVPDRGDGWLTHRRLTPEGRLVFVVNQLAEAGERWLPAPGTSPVEVYDPLSHIVQTPQTRGSNERREVRLTLAPGESRFVGPQGLFAGEPAAHRHAAPREISFSGPWTLSFVSGGPALPAEQTLARLRSWTELPGAEAFAGTAVYRTVFTVAQEDAARHWRLQLGDVREAARVRLNGSEIGAVWAHPFQLDMTAPLRVGANLLEIEVTNHAANRIRELDLRGVRWRVFHDINFVDIHYTGFDASRWPVAPAGLLSEVKWVELVDADPAPAAH